MDTIIEDRLEFSEETKRNIAKSEAEIKAGKTISLNVLKLQIFYK